MPNPNPPQTRRTAPLGQHVVSLLCLAALLALGAWQAERGCAYTARLEGQAAGASAGLHADVARLEGMVEAFEHEGGANRQALEQRLAGVQRAFDRLSSERDGFASAKRALTERLATLKDDRREAEDERDSADDAFDEAERSFDRHIATFRDELSGVDINAEGVILQDGVVYRGCKEAEREVFGVRGRDLTDAVTDTCAKIDEAERTLALLQTKREQAQGALDAAKARFDTLRDDVKAAEGRVSEAASRLSDADRRLADMERTRSDAQLALDRFERLYGADFRRAEAELSVAREAMHDQLRSVARRGEWALPFEVYEAWVMALVCALGALGVALRWAQLSGGPVGFGLVQAEPRGAAPAHEALDAENANTCALRLAPGQVLWSRCNRLKSAHMGARVRPPWWSGAPFGRVWHGVYRMDRVSVERPERVELVGDDPNGAFHIVRLRAGERRVVHLKHVMGVVIDQDAPHKVVATGLGGLLKPAYWLWGHTPPAVFEGPATLILYGARLRACEDAPVTLQATQAVAFDPSCDTRGEGAGALKLIPSLSATLGGQLINAFSFDSRIRAASGQAAGLVMLEFAPPLPPLHRFGRFVLRHVVIGTLALVTLRWALMWAMNAPG